MADQILTTLFVVPQSTAIPTSGSTNALTSGQLGFFLPNNTAATVGTVGNAKYIYLAQGRNVYSMNQGTKKSDWILPENLINWYKVEGSLTAATQITEITNLTAGCQEDISLIFRLDSFYIRAAYRNSLTRAVMVTTPCCNCGSNPCDSLTAGQITDVWSAFIVAINTDPILSSFVTAYMNGTNDGIFVEGKTLETYGQGTSVDLTNFPYQFDRMFFWTYARSGPQLTTDYEVQDICAPVADIAIMQRASYPTNTPYEIKQLEKDFWSYQSEYKHIFSNVNYNGEFETYVDSANAYDLYYLNFWEPITTGRDIGVTRKDEWVCIAVPQMATAYSSIDLLLTAAFGAPDNENPSDVTTTTFSTGTTTTTTTYVNPTP
jgi:hypothetical protein